MQVSVHARLEHRDAAELVELVGMRLVVEGAGDQHVEAGIALRLQRIDQFVVLVHAHGLRIRVGLVVPRA